jgi:hypothetical protein
MSITSDEAPKCDIDSSPTVLLASLFAARRAGDPVLVRLFLRRLAALGIHIAFVPGGAPGADPGIGATSSAAAPVGGE